MRFILLGPALRRTIQYHPTRGKYWYYQQELLVKQHTVGLRFFTQVRGLYVLSVRIISFTYFSISEGVDNFHFNSYW